MGGALTRRGVPAHGPWPVAGELWLAEVYERGSGEELGVLSLSQVNMPNLASCGGCRGELQVNSWVIVGSS